MNLSALEFVFWSASFLANAALFVVLIFRGRGKVFPIFTVLMGFGVAQSVLMYAIYRSSFRSWYTWAYFVGEFPGFALQLGVVWEIARFVLRPTGSWVRDARKQFVLWGAAGILLAAALPWLVAPPDSNLVISVDVRGNLFTSLVMCELVTILLLTSNRLGLGWRNHVMALGNGWGIMAVLDIVVDGLHSYFGVLHYYRALEQAQMLAYSIILIYWMVEFWREEPMRRPISPELRAYIEDLHRRTKNDLDTLSARR